MFVSRTRLAVCFGAALAFMPACLEAQDFGSLQQNRVAQAFDGFYAGVHAGYSSTEYNASLNPGANVYGSDPGGTSYGVYGGFNMPLAVNVVAGVEADITVGSSRVDLQACKLEYSIVSPK